MRINSVALYRSREDQLDQLEHLCPGCSNFRIESHVTDSGIVVTVVVEVPDALDIRAEFVSQLKRLLVEVEWRARNRKGVA